MLPTESLLPPRPRRRWLRLSLRGLMVLVLIIGGVVGWLAHTVRTQRQAIAAVRAAGGSVQINYHWRAMSIGPQGAVLADEPVLRTWLRRWLGDEWFQHVWNVSLKSGPVDPQMFAALAHFDRLQSINVNGATGIGPGFAKLGGLRHLTSISLISPNADDTVLAGIAKLGSLRRLMLERPDATDGGFARLARLQQLTSLEIHGCPNLTDAGLGFLAAIKTLTDLELVGCPTVSDAGLTRLLAGGSTLKRVTLAGNDGLAAPVTLLARHQPGLEVLTVSGPICTDADVAAIGGLTRLKSVTLLGSRITDAGLTPLGSLASLTALDLNNTHLTDSGMEVLGTFPALNDLTLSRTKVGDAGLAHLARLPLLRLELDGCGVTDAGMAALARMTTLEDLSLRSLPGLTDAGLMTLRTLTQLRRLDVGGTQMTPAGVAALQAVLPKLTHVNTRASAWSTTHPPLK